MRIPLLRRAYRERQRHATIQTEAVTFSVAALIWLVWARRFGHNIDAWS